MLEAVCLMWNRFCHWCGGGWARLVVIVIGSGVDGGGVVVAITVAAAAMASFPFLGCIECHVAGANGSHRATTATTAVPSLFFFLFEASCAVTCWIGCSLARAEVHKKCCATYASAIPDDVHVKLVDSSIDDTPYVDSNDLDARIITFHPFYFSLGFTFPLSMFFRKVFCTMECAPSQCTVNVYWVIMCFENLNHFFKLELTAWEFFYFFKVRRYKKYAQAHVCKAKLFDKNDICKRLDLELDMVKIRLALSILGGWEMEVVWSKLG
ncbi:unnamed protein product [Prunus armeniaca]